MNEITTWVTDLATRGTKITLCLSSRAEVTGTAEIVGEDGDHALVAVSSRESVLVNLNHVIAVALPDR